MTTALDLEEFTITLTNSSLPGGAPTARKELVAISAAEATSRFNVVLPEKSAGSLRLGDIVRASEPEDVLVASYAATQINASLSLILLPMAAFEKNKDGRRTYVASGDRLDSMVLQGRRVARVSRETQGMNWLGSIMIVWEKQPYLVIILTFGLNEDQIKEAFAQLA